MNQLKKKQNNFSQLKQANDVSQYFIRETLSFLESVESFSRKVANAKLKELNRQFNKARVSSDDVRAGFSLVNMASVYQGQRQYHEMVKVLTLAKDIFLKISHDYGLAFVYQELSFANRELVRNSLAMEYAHKALTLFQGLGATFELGWAYDNIAMVFFNRGQRREAIIYAKKAKAIFLEFSSDVGLAWNSCTFATIYQDSGEHQKSIESYQYAISKMREVHSQNGLAWSLLGLGTIYRSLCQFDLAEKYILEAKNLYESMDLIDRVAYCCLHLAAIIRQRGKVSEAYQLNRKALKIFGPLRESNGMAWTLFQIAQILRDQGFIVKAWQIFNQAIGLHSDLYWRVGIGWSENDLGIAYALLTDSVHARECFNKVIEIANQIDNKPLLAKAELGKLNLSLTQGDLEAFARQQGMIKDLQGTIKSKEFDIEFGLLEAKYFICKDQFSEAKEKLISVGKMIKECKADRFLAEWNLIQGELQVCQKNMSAAVENWKQAAQCGIEYSQKFIEINARLGLIQLEACTLEGQDVLQKLSKIEAETRLMNARGIRAKCLGIRAFIEQKKNGHFSEKHFLQAIRSLHSAGAYLAEKQILEFAIQTAIDLGLSLEAGEFKGSLKELESILGSNLNLITTRKEFFKVLPVSIISV
ncbi:MAG: tetratricopeptide repeat protein [Elusimicrobiota bacterium]